MVGCDDEEEEPVYAFTVGGVVTNVIFDDAYMKHYTS